MEAAEVSGNGRGCRVLGQGSRLVPGQVASWHGERGQEGRGGLESCSTETL